LAFDFEQESIRIAARSIRERKLRSGLTALGIIIGIAAVISIMSIGAGTQAYIDDQFQQFGANRIIISPRISSGPSAMGGASGLKEKDLDTIKRVRGVQTAMAIYSTTMPVAFKSQTNARSLTGVDSADAKSFFSGVQAFEIDTGRFIRPGDKYAAVVGSLAAKNAFGDELRVRDKLLIGNRSFEVVGIMKETGGSSDDNMIIVPLETLRDVSGEKDKISFVFVKAADASMVEDVADAIQSKFDELYGSKAFTVLSTTKLAGQVTAITGTLTLVLSGIAGIALLVAGIGIANTMYMSTIERTHEIGIMKAIGATQWNILEIFLAEAAMIGLAGGVAGTVLGTAVSYVIGIALKATGVSFATLVTPELAALGICFSVIVGVVSGFMPARSAARMSPIEALRYE